MDRLLGFDAQLIHDCIITGINVFILFLGLSYMLFNPVRSFLAKRQEKIANELENAKKNEADAIALKAEYDTKLKEINKEAEEIFDAARKSGKKREAVIIEDAKAEAAKIIERAHTEVALEKKKALEDLKQEVISIASLMAGKVVAASIDTKVQDTLIEETLKEMGDNTWLS